MGLPRAEDSNWSPLHAGDTPARGHPGGPGAPAALLLIELADAAALMALDAAGTTRRWQRFVHRARQTVLARHHGRLLSALDGGLLLGFLHVRRALQAAAELHQLVALANAPAPTDAGTAPAAAAAPLRLRATIHMAPAPSGAAAMSSATDAATDADALAEPLLRRLIAMNARAGAGDTLLSAAARECLADGLDATVEDLGEPADDVDAAPAPSSAAGALPPDDAPPDGLARAYRVVAAAADAPRPSPPGAAAELHAAIAVVPFDSHARWHEHMAIGDLIADGVIARLARSRHLRVINRLSTQALRGRHNTVAEMQQHLAATHVLSGDFAESGGRLAIRYELRELAEDRVVHAGRLSTSLGDLLQPGNEPIAMLAQQVHDALFDESGQAVLARPLPTLQSYALLLGGIRLLHRSARQDFTASFDVLDHLARQHPRCAEPLIWQAKWYALRAVQGLTVDRAAEARTALDCVSRALDAEPDNSFALAMGGFVHCVLTRDQDAAARTLQQAVALNANESLGHLFQAMTQGLQGRLDEGIASFGAATAISPLDPACYIYDSIGAYLHLAAGHQAHAVALARRSLRLNREHAHSWRALTIAQAELGRLDEARASLHELLRLQPDLTLRSYLAGAQADERNRGRFAEALGRAGLPA